jgi:tRNA pseudouridine38-40 synthase
MRVALGLSYFGAPYQGWQSQPSAQTVQDQLELALEGVAGHTVRVSCAGRTDAGVHACLQVVHFDPMATRKMQSWVRGTNANLPRDIAVQWAVAVSDDFHSRSSALSRRYVYLLKQSAVRPGLEMGRVGWSFRPLDFDRLRAAADLLLGEHDFSAFRASQCQALSPIKNMLRLDIARFPQSDCCYYRFDFEANAFLHHMIRNIMGCLLMVGDGRCDTDWLRHVMVSKSRQLAAPTFSADGLYFLGPRYAPHWGIPDKDHGFHWLLA